MEVFFVESSVLVPKILEIAELLFVERSFTEKRTMVKSNVHLYVQTSRHWTTRDFAKLAFRSADLIGQEHIL